MVLVLIGACAARDEASLCLEEMKAEDYRAAVATCERAFALRGTSELGGAAARAHYFLGEDDAVLAFAEKLSDAKNGGSVWHLAGRIHERRNETDGARTAYKRALGHRSAEDHGGRALDAEMLSISYWRETRYREALDYAHIDLDEAVASHESLLEARAHIILGDVYYEVGYAALADAEYQRAATAGGENAALKVKEGLIHKTERRPALARMAYQAAIDLAPAGEVRTTVSARINLAELALADRNLDEAARHLEAVRAILAKRGDRQGQISYRYYHALWARAKGDLEVAMGDLDAAAQLEPVPDWSWQLDEARGHVLAAQGDRTGAVAAYRRSIETLEEMRRTFGADELKAWFLPRRRAPYEALFELEVEGGRPLDALAVVERTRARDFVDRYLAASRAPGTDPGGPATMIASDLDAARSLIAVLESRKDFASQPFEQVLRAVTRHHIIGYFEENGRVWLCVIAGGDVRFRELPVSALDVAKLVDRLLVSPDDLAAARQLGELLLPADALPPRGVPLELVLDAALERVPFAALRVGNRWFVEDHAIAVVPSVAMLALIAERPSDEGTASALVIGDAANDLPAAKDEASRVAVRFGVEAHVGRDASVALLRESARTPLLHVAVHAGIGPAGPWLELADGAVSAAQILEWQLHPRVVVLAGCASGAAAPGMWASLGAAFLAAGSRQVLVTSRSVDDEATAHLIDRFYQEGGASDAANALARTQRAFARTLPPSRWASFFVIGSVALTKGVTSPAVDAP